MMITAILALALTMTAEQATRSNTQGFPVRNGITYLEQPVDIDGSIYSSAWPSLAGFVAQLQRGDRSGVKAALRDLVARGKADDGALNLLAQIERHDGDLDIALHRIEGAIKTAPRQHLHYFQEGLICFQLREKASSGPDRWKWHSRTQEAYEKALELEPKGVYYRYYVAYSYLSTPAAVGGDKQKALKLAQEGIDSGHDAFYVIRADVYRSLGRLTEAYSDYDRSLQHRFFKTNSFLGALHSVLEQKALTRAKNYCAYLVAAVPDEARAHEACGDYLSAIGDIDKAIQAYRTALQKDPNLATAAEKLSRLKK